LPGRAGKEEDLIKRFDNLFRVLDRADFGMPADRGAALEKLLRHECRRPGLRLRIQAGRGAERRIRAFQQMMSPCCSIDGARAAVCHPANQPEDRP
jgi:hypothetical protein